MVVMMGAQRAEHVLVGGGVRPAAQIQAGGEQPGSERVERALDEEPAG
jgi:hypothetical protein